MINGVDLPPVGSCVSGPTCPVCGHVLVVQLRVAPRTGKPFWYAACVVPQHIKMFIHYSFGGNGWDDLGNCPVCREQMCGDELENPTSRREYTYLSCPNRCARGFAHVPGFIKKVNKRDKRKGGQ